MRDEALDAIIATAQSPRADGRPAVIAAAEIAAQVCRQQPDAEAFALWLADAVLATSLRWPVALPLLAGQIHHPSLKRGGCRIKPGEPEWVTICCLAYARAAMQACDLAADIGRRASRLLAVAPKLRAKGSAAAVAALLQDDALTASATIPHLSDRGLRRLLDRLVALGAIRELSGRPSFRIYGL